MMDGAGRHLRTRWQPIGEASRNHCGEGQSGLTIAKTERCGGDQQCQCDGTAQHLDHQGQIARLRRVHGQDSPQFSPHIKLGALQMDALIGINRTKYF